PVLRPWPTRARQSLARRHPGMGGADAAAELQLRIRAGGGRRLSAMARPRPGRARGTQRWMARRRCRCRELLGTGIVSARPEQVVFLSSSSWLPLACAGVVALLLACFIAGW